MLDQVFLGNSVKRWIIAAAIVIGALIIGRIVSSLFKAIFGRFKSQIASSIAGGIGKPITTFILLVGARVAVESLELPAGVKALAEKGATFFSVVVITWLIANAYEAIHKGVLEPYARRPESSVDVHLFVVMRIVVDVVVWVVGLASALNSVGFEVSAILAGLGIGGMALALASQDTVANLFGGVLVLTQRPFKVGERIEVDGVNGWVHQFGLRNTIIKNWYGRQVLIPNKKFTDSVVINIDSQTLYYQEERIRLDPRSTAEEVEKALEILADIVRDIDLLDKTPWIMFDKIEHGFFEIEFWYGIPRWNPKESATIPNEYEKICRAKTRVNLEILKRFAAARIMLAVPVEVQFELNEPQMRPLADGWKVT